MGYVSSVHITDLVKNDAYSSCYIELRDSVHFRTWS